jgi:hypothetical protein
MGSPLDFINSDGFRKKLITRNLTPYAKAPNRPTPPFNTEYIQSDTSVQDSPDQLIDEPSFANKLYPLNQYGNEGGYEQVPDPGGLMNTKSNEGEYGFQDANIVGQSLPESQKWKPLNVYSNGSQVQLDSAEFFGSLDKPLTTNNYNNQPYPTTFVPSTYSPISILLSPDPSGSNGFVSQDSFIVKLGAQTLRKEFETRIAAQIRKDTLGRANVLNVNSGTDLVNILTGVVPLIEPNYTITVSANPVLAATNFALRLAGSVLPVSPIPGSYWDTSVNTGQPGTIQQTLLGNPRSVVSKFFNKLLGGGQTGTQIFYNNTGAGQKSLLFKNIDFNKYKPNYERSLLNRLGGALVGATTNNSNYYVGSITADPSRVFSPGGEVPVNQFGQEQQDPVYGPSELAQLYEGPSKDIRLGANGPTYSNGGGIEGGFTWVSPKYKGNAGKKVGVGGLIVGQDEDFKPSSYNSTESTERTLKGGSILEKTQRIIDSQPQGGKRLQHVGNAIDQVSKVFNDGYKEMTKGSRVLSYVGSLGNEVGTEYCRVFAKDIPYLQYNDLQKTDGITTEGRRFSDSVLDKTYNLNMYPNKQEGGKDSTNLIGSTTNAYAKKYMFSLENLAWRTSSTPGFTVSDLAICERGPNGGRVMWFAPYGLTFTESTSTNWNQSDFLGRPEPIYTYKNTSRSGSLSWKIVVDHPSVLNIIVNKVLNNETNKARIDGMIDSFFAGCKKYDLYELAKKYYNVPPGDLFLLQQAITSKEITKEQLQYSLQTIRSGVAGGQGQTTASNPTQDPFEKYKDTAFYYGNDYPKPNTTINYTEEYTRYTSESNKNYYKTKSPSTAEQTLAFFTNVVEANYKIMNELATELDKQFTESESGTVTIYFTSSCSAPATIAYNEQLSKRRIEAAIKFFAENPKTSKWYNLQRLLVKTDPDVRAGALGEKAQVKQIDPKTGQPKPGIVVNCTDSNETVAGGDSEKGNSVQVVGSKEVLTTNAMACRRAYISKILPKLVGKTVPPTVTPPQYTDVLVGNVVTETVTTQETTREWKPRDNITKYVLRVLLSECDYFETIKEETPMVYDNLKEKLKFFQPAFHSTTPEGLNTRLTFLNQCMRPGETIPTIKDIGGTQQVQYNNATNTAFGAPPVLILRVGDFYNTKIIPTSLQFQYEQLDINPEGIGIQPMIANVTMAFNFVGGSGLKTAVDKLQNALTFNYYANSEIWDDRADVTAQEKFLEVLDKEFLDRDTAPAPPTSNQASPNSGQDNNSTVGKILTNVVTTDGETGTISYGEFMGKVVSDTQTYFTNVVNKTKETVNQYNNAVRQQWMLERSYTQGNLNVTDSKIKTVIFGKPNNVEKRFDEIFAGLQDDIKNGTEGFIQFISAKQRNFSDSLKRTVTSNYGNLVKNKRSSFQSAITKITQDLTTIEQNYIQTLARVNLIAFQGITTEPVGTDGFQAKSGPVRVYVTKGTDKVSANANGATNTYEELVNDITKIMTDISEFNAATWESKKFNYPGNSKEYEGVLVSETDNVGITISKSVTPKNVFAPFSTNANFDSNVFRKVYMIMSDDVLDDKKYQTFKNAMIGNIIGNKSIIGDGFDDIEKVFDDYWLTIAKPVFLEENNITKSFIENLEKTTLKKYLVYTPFDTKKTREFTYTTENTASDEKKKSQQNMIKGLAASSNQNTLNNNWNDDNGNSTGAYISKAKLN